MKFETSDLNMLDKFGLTILHWELNLNVRIEDFLFEVVVFELVAFELGYLKYLKYLNWNHKIWRFWANFDWLSTIQIRIWLWIWKNRCTYYGKIWLTTNNKEWNLARNFGKNSNFHATSKELASGLVGNNTYISDYSETFNIKCMCQKNSPDLWTNDNQTQTT